VPLRVAIDRSAYGDIAAHARETLDRDICGVLAGALCADDEGPFVHVEAAVRGSAADQGHTHVTFTHDTWNAIHQTMEKEHPKLQIVGWYHSHPGFGVEFSEMDLFIQRNFFSGPSQVAIVTDPLGGDVAICANADGDVKYLDKFWVDGRQHKGRVPGKMSDAAETVAAAASAPANEKLEAIETRVAQLLASVEDLRGSHYRFLLNLGMFAAILLVFYIGYSIYRGLTNENMPPESISWAPVPVTIEGKTCLVGLRVERWEIPPSLVADLTKLALEKEKAAEEAKQAAAKQAEEKSAKADEKKSEKKSDAKVDDKKSDAKFDAKPKESSPPAKPVAGPSPEPAAPSK